MKKFFFLLFFALALFIFSCWRLPASVPLKLETLPQTENTLLLPLDSRPVCTQLPAQLASIAGTNVILPPKEFLDNYQKPADRQKLYAWLRQNAPKTDNAIISSDLLLHGGLLPSRLSSAPQSEQKYFLEQILQLARANPQLPICAFSIVPRLLVSDELLTDRWYQWHLMRYSQLRDMTETFADPYFTEQQQKLAREIPPEVLQKYASLYRGNDIFNKYFVSLALEPNVTTIIGQDDGSAFGLPNRNLHHAASYGKYSVKNHTTYGADEIAALAIAKNYLQKINWQPRVYTQYADPASEFSYMPYMPGSSGATVRDKIKLAGALNCETPQTADIILYVNCGSDNFKPGVQQVREVTQLLNAGKKVALIDLSANFEAEELLLPLLLEQEAPVNKLAAYAGWNTFSNSAGTALAQAVIFSGRLRQLESKDYPRLYAANLSFIVHRILDDYVYQKVLHAQLKKRLLAEGYDPVNLTETGKLYAESIIQPFISWQAEKILRANLGRTPFYSDGHTEYYLRSITAGASLPWQRIFETRLDVYCRYGTSNH